jgi:hypothetical protein
MNEMLAYCGIRCDACPAYTATAADSDEMRRNTAAEWSKLYRADIKPEQIHCRGCRSGVRFAHCGVCEIRACTQENNRESCGVCDSFPCGKVQFVLDRVPGARERLEAAGEAARQAPPEQRSGQG